ncbi:MAG: imidazole glycerol phosphate synthase subunit HisH [Lentisphaeria bacterium]|nr:imidazole glycerol phosphate synthase subunit HisH [Lentisphaeria bacterium]
MAVALLDYNMGNLGSVRKALEFAGADVELVESAAELARFSCCILPGVGHFRDGMENLRSRGFDRAIPELLERGGYFFGVCLGMQMLLEASDEAPGVAGLGLFPGRAVRFPEGRAKVPHMGWNSVVFRPECPLGGGLPEESFFYFVHSYYIPVSEAYTMAECDYIVPFSACLGRGRCFAAQFHPEKSQRSGLRLLTNFLHFAGEVK